MKHELIITKVGAPDAAPDIRIQWYESPGQDSLTTDVQVLQRREIPARKPKRENINVD